MLFMALILASWLQNNGSTVHHGWEEFPLAWVCQAKGRQGLSILLSVNNHIHLFHLPTFGWINILKWYNLGGRGTSRDVKQQRIDQARQEAMQVREEYDAGARANPYAGVLSTRHPPAPTTVHPTYSPGSDGIPHRVLPPPTCYCYLKGATATPRHSFHRSHQLHSSPASPSPVNSDLGNLTSCPSYFRV